MVFPTLECERLPLNSQLPKHENGGGDFHHYWFVDSG